MNNARNHRGQFNINNIVDAVDTMPWQVIEEISWIIDNPEFDLATSDFTPENIQRAYDRQSYYVTQGAFLINLWGALKYETERTDSRRMQIRDYIEKAASAAFKKSETASRLITAFQEIREMNKERRPT